MPDLRKATFKVFEANGLRDRARRAVQPEQPHLRQEAEGRRHPDPGPRRPLKQFVRGETETLVGRAVLRHDREGHGRGRDERHHPHRRVLRAGEDRPEDARAADLLVPLGREVPRRQPARAATATSAAPSSTAWSQASSRTSSSSAPRARRCARCSPSRSTSTSRCTSRSTSSTCSRPTTHRSHVLGARRDARARLVPAPRQRADWRHVAVANGIDDPRRLDPGPHALRFHRCRVGDRCRPRRRCTRSRRTPRRLLRPALRGEDRRRRPPARRAVRRPQRHLRDSIDAIDSFKMASTTGTTSAANSSTSVPRPQRAGEGPPRRAARRRCSSPAARK